MGPLLCFSPVPGVIVVYEMGPGLTVDILFGLWMNTGHPGKVQDCMLGVFPTTLTDPGPFMVLGCGNWGCGVAVGPM